MSKIVVHYGSKNATLFQGLINSPNGRGTVDIVWACLITVFLCSWSILCLNLPAHSEGFWHRARRKFYWTLLTVLGPEIIFQLSLGQWLAARRWTKEFRNLGYPRWSMTHSFYAQMGGFHLYSSDASSSFPINLAQLHWLLQRSYVKLPNVKKKTILDKNKAEAMVRILTIGQTLWFTINCIARAIQGIAVTTLELSTLAFISSALGTVFTWFHKPMDVETPISLTLEVPMDEILRREGREHEQWQNTPLDFVDRKRQWPWNLYWHYGMTIATKKLKLTWIILRPTDRPIKRLHDDNFPEPTLKSLPVLFVFHVAYAAILMAGWNLELPTATELLLWRIASCIQLGTIVSAWLTMPLQIHDVPPSLQRLFDFARKEKRKFTWRHDHSSAAEEGRWYRKASIVKSVKSRAEGARTLISDDPNWRASLRLLVLYECTVIIYMVARLYIVVEDFVSLRAMPPSSFDTVNWQAWWPHISR